MAAVVIAEVDEIEPSYEEARLRPDWPEWRKAIDVELWNLELAETWDVVERPSSDNTDSLFERCSVLNKTNQQRKELLASTAVEV